jgi:hypothetical protein
LVVDIANVRAAAPLIDGDDRSALAATCVVDSVVVAFQRHQMYRIAAVEDGEVWQHVGGGRV